MAAEAQMQADRDTPIFVQREWDGWRTAEVRLHDLEDIHWFQPSRAPRALAHGYISCASMAAGHLPHDCERSAGPHRLLICILKKHCSPSAYAEIARRADEHRSLLATARADTTATPESASPLARSSAS